MIGIAVIDTHCVCSCRIIVVVVVSVDVGVTHISGWRQVASVVSDRRARNELRGAWGVRVSVLLSNKKIVREWLKKTGRSGEGWEGARERNWYLYWLPSAGRWPGMVTMGTGRPPWGLPTILTSTQLAAKKKTRNKEVISSLRDH